MLSLLLLHASMVARSPLGVRGVDRAGAPIMSAELLTDPQTLELLDDGSFAHAIEQRHAVVVDFFADYCGPCKLVDPSLNALHERGDVGVAKARLDECPSTYNWLRSHDIVIDALPACVLFVDGKPVRHMSGIFDLERLDALVDGRPTSAAVALPRATARRKDNTALQIAAAVPLLFIALVAAVTTVKW